MFTKNSIIFDDLFRYTGKRSWFLLIRYIFFTPGFRYVYLFRKTSQSKTLITKVFWLILMRQCMLRTGIQIPAYTKIKKGFRITHYGHIVINPDTIIGENFNICQGVTIGHSEGKRKGSPIIGNNVSIQPNAVIVGNINIGHDVLIAPNSFVNIDVPDGCIAIGNPAKIIEREKASSKYIVYYV
jgi:serine O-acetyltransferase